MSVHSDTVASTAAVSAGLALLQQIVLALLGVSLTVPVAAFAGVMYGLTYRDPMTPTALWLNIVGATLLSSVCAPLLGHLVSAPELLVAGIAGCTGFLSQYGYTWARDRRTKILDTAAEKLGIKGADK